VYDSTFFEVCLIHHYFLPRRLRHSRRRHISVIMWTCVASSLAWCGHLSAVTGLFKFFIYCLRSPNFPIFFFLHTRAWIIGIWVLGSTWIFGRVFLYAITACGEWCCFPGRTRVAFLAACVCVVLKKWASKGGFGSFLYYHLFEAPCFKYKWKNEAEIMRFLKKWASNRWKYKMTGPLPRIHHA